jgi:hypothetical protein
MLLFAAFAFCALVYSRISAYSLAPTLKQVDLQGLPLWLIPLVYLADYASHGWSCLLFAFVVAGLMYEFIPKDLINRYMRKSRLKGYLLAAAIAPIFTVCSCTMVPIFAGILYIGAGIGPAIVFLLMAPAANFMTILLTGELIAWDIALARLLAALVTAIAAGLIIARTPWGRAIQAEFTVETDAKSAAIALVKPPLDERLWTGLKFSGYLAKKILPFFIAGLVAVSYFVAFVPETLIAPYLTGVQGVLLASIIGGPLYTPTLVEIALGRAFLGLGMSRGALLSWLMGQPYDIPNMVATSRVVRWKVVATYALIAWAFSVIFGLLYSVLTGWA